MGAVKQVASMALFPFLPPLRESAFLVVGVAGFVASFALAFAWLQQFVLQSAAHSLTYGVVSVVCTGLFALLLVVDVTEIREQR